MHWLTGRWALNLMKHSGELDDRMFSFESSNFKSLLLHVSILFLPNLAN